MKIAYDRSGQGPPSLVLLHGFTGSRAAWSHLRSVLAPGIASVAVDLPGHGQSEPCALSGPEGFAQTLAALVGVLDELGAGAVDVLGYSQGARLALALAIEWPGRVRRLILESGTAGLKRSRDRTVRRRRDEALAAEIELHGIEAFVDRWEALPLFAGVRRLAPELVRSVRAARLECSEQAWPARCDRSGSGCSPTTGLCSPGFEPRRFSSPVGAIANSPGLPKRWRASCPWPGFAASKASGTRRTWKPPTGSPMK